jgi:hypothetical protein
VADIVELVSTEVYKHSILREINSNPVISSPLFPSLLSWVPVLSEGLSLTRRKPLADSECLDTGSSGSSAGWENVVGDLGGSLLVSENSQLLGSQDVLSAFFNKTLGNQLDLDIVSDCNLSWAVSGGSWDNWHDSKLDSVCRARSYAWIYEEVILEGFYFIVRDRCHDVTCVLIETDIGDCLATGICSVESSLEFA